MPKHLKLYEVSLRLYPKRYRDEYGEQMTQTLADMLDDQPTTLSRVFVWSRIAKDLPVSIVQQNIISIGDTFMNQAPFYVKRNGIITTSLLAPFLAAVTANTVATLVFRHDLYRSWVWSFPVLLTWILFLPLLAFALAVITYFMVVTKNTNQSLFKRLVNVRQVWPILVPGLLGLGILFILVFHDSAHCWVENPINIATQWNKTMQCTQSGMLGGR